MQLQGAWADALEEARRAAERWFTEGVLNQLACGKALYRQGEVHRLRGEFEAAEDAYREASRCGCEPQPGLALLRLAQGDRDAAAAAIRRAVGETTEPLRRAALLPAYVEIMLAAGDVEAARSRLPSSSRRSRSDTGARCWPRCPRTRGEPCSWPTATPGAALIALRHACARVAGARGALRRRACPGAHRARLPRAGRRGRRGARAARRRAVPSTASGRAPSFARVDSLSGGRRLRRRPRAHGARARGAPPGRDRKEQPRDRRGR